MNLSIAGIPRQAIGLLESLDMASVRHDQAWVLGVMQRDGPALTRLLWRMLGSEQEVLDAYQDCFCKLLAQFERDCVIPHRGYIFRTAVNVAIDARRHRRIRSDHSVAVARSRLSFQPESSQPSAPTVDSTDLVACLQTAISALPERLRDVVVLRDLAELSYRDVARVLGITSGTARVYRREAIQELSARLAES